MDWFRPDGNPMSSGDWSNPAARAVTMGLPDEDAFLLLVNGWWEPLSFQVPGRSAAADWQVLVDTAQAIEGQQLGRPQAVELVERALVLLERLPRTASLGAPGPES